MFAICCCLHLVQTGVTSLKLLYSYVKKCSFHKSTNSIMNSNSSIATHLTLINSLMVCVKKCESGARKLSYVLAIKVIC